MRPNTGSFEYYIGLGDHDPFFKFITKAMMHADVENFTKMANALPHLAEAKAISRWDVAPISRNRFLNNDQKEVKHIDAKIEFEKDSFYWYLSMGGDFTKNMCNAIMYADASNLEKLKEQFPHLVEKFLSEYWNVS